MNHGGPYLQEHNKQFSKHNTIVLNWHESIFFETQQKIIETQHKLFEVQHKIMEAQHKILADRSGKPRY